MTEPVTVGALAAMLGVPVQTVCQQVSTLIFRMGRDEVIAQAAGMRTTILTAAGAAAIRRTLGAEADRTREEVQALRVLHFAEAADLIDEPHDDCGCSGCDSCTFQAAANKLRAAVGLPTHAEAALIRPAMGSE